MAVRKNQIQGLINIVLLHVTQAQAVAILEDLAETETYMTNGSFRETIKRMLIEARKGR